MDDLKDVKQFISILRFGALAICLLGTCGGILFAALAPTATKGWGVVLILASLLASLPLWALAWIIALLTDIANSLRQRAASTPRQPTIRPLQK